MSGGVGSGLHTYIVHWVGWLNQVGGVAKDRGFEDSRACKSLCKSQSTEGVAGVVKVSGLPWLVQESPPLILTADEEIFLKGSLVEQPVVGER